MKILPIIILILSWVASALAEPGNGSNSHRKPGPLNAVNAKGDQESILRDYYNATEAGEESSISGYLADKIDYYSYGRLSKFKVMGDKVCEPS